MIKKLLVFIKMLETYFVVIYKLKRFITISMNKSFKYKLFFVFCWGKNSIFDVKINIPIIGQKHAIKHW